MSYSIVRIDLGKQATDGIADVLVLSTYKTKIKALDCLNYLLSRDLDRPLSRRVIVFNELSYGYIDACGDNIVLSCVKSINVESIKVMR